MKISEITVNGWKFPTYTNHKKIHKFEKLTYFDKALKKKEDEAAVAKRQRTSRLMRRSSEIGAHAVSCTFLS